MARLRTASPSRTHRCCSFSETRIASSLPPAPPSLPTGSPPFTTAPSPTRAPGRSVVRPAAPLLIGVGVLVAGPTDQPRLVIVEQVPEPTGLGAQIVSVVLAGRVLDRQLLAHPHAMALEAGDLARIVGQEPDGRHAEVGEDLGADPVVTQVGGQTKP